MASLYLSNAQVCAALGIQPQDWRALKRVFRPKIATVNPRPSHAGKLPAILSLDDVINFTKNINLLTPATELSMRVAARQEGHQT